MSTIQTQNLTKKFGNFTAVDNLNLDIQTGEIYGLLGHNGAGKTTTINMLIGVQTPTSGTITILGHDTAKHPIEARRQIGLLPDTSGNYGHLSARHNLGFFAELAGIKKQEAGEKIDELIELVGLSDWIDEKTENYSRGMKRRLGIAQSLIRNPQVLIYDEPTLGIDPEGTIMIRELIRKLAKEQGKTILMTTHLLPEVSRLCDRVAIMSHGKLVTEGTLDELRSMAGEDDLENIFLRAQEVI
jgi:ABC-2 type transport system ATP-binding protein